MALRQRLILYFNLLYETTMWVIRKEKDRKIGRYTNLHTSDSD